jgi:small subunit ribosomal protein S20
MRYTQEEYQVANHKSAEKRNRQAQVRRVRNRMNKNKMKTMVRKLDEAVAGGSVEAAQEAFRVATSVIAKTASKGTIHKNTASRKISRLAKRVNALTPVA